MARTGSARWHPGLVTAGQAETYLRLRAEAELRRALTLPRVDPPDEDGLPGPLRLHLRTAIGHWFRHPDGSPAPPFWLMA